MTTVAAPVRVVLLRGENAFAIERAIARLADDLGNPEQPLATWRIDLGDDRSAAGIARAMDQIGERVATAPLFGGGTLVVVRSAAALARDSTGRARLEALLGAVPPGNGLALVDQGDGRARRAGAADPLGDAVAAAGGRSETFSALTRERMEHWLDERARELGATLAPAAARLLAERVGAYVREGDVDRRLQTALADQELRKLALRRPGGTIEREDVVDLVPEAVPGSTWAFLDAVAERQAGRAAEIAERLLAEGTALPLLVARLHRRLREILVAREHLAAGARAGELVRLMRLQPYRAQRLAAAAEAWGSVELQAALEGLLELDLMGKGLGLDGQPLASSDERAALGLQVWLAERVRRRDERS
ncbi:MAG TPA: DNA polymerase III subunit delta [Candidatus Dormibacteraeota bacterium]|nr:DNA polymerase III subunit delta [Candidatus Dormibacteraeota bacterium]